MEEAGRAALIRARSGLAVRVELAEEAPEAPEASPDPGIIARLMLLTPPIRELLEAHPEQGVEEEVEELLLGSLARGVAVVAVVAVEVLREIRVTLEIPGQPQILRHTIAFQLLAARPTQ